MQDRNSYSVQKYINKFQHQWQSARLDATAR